MLNEHVRDTRAPSHDLIKGGVHKTGYVMNSARMRRQRYLRLLHRVRQRESLEGSLVDEW